MYPLTRVSRGVCLWQPPWIAVQNSFCPLSAEPLSCLVELEALWLPAVVAVGSSAYCSRLVS